MPNNTWTQALKEAYASAPSDVVLLHTLEFRHAAFSAPIRVVLNNENITATLEASAPLNPNTAVEFLAFAFEFELPESSETGVPEISIIIDNTDPIITRALDDAMETTDKLYVSYRPYLSTDLSAPQMDPVWHMVVTEVDCDDYRVRARAGFGDLLNKRFPSELYDTRRFPGLQV